MTIKTATVIGGGIAGCSTAYALAQRGIKVTLFERHVNIASEASGNPVAILYPRINGDFIRSQYAMEGYLHTLELLKKINLKTTNFSTCGLLQLGFNPRELSRIKNVDAQNYPANVLKYVTQFEASSLSGIEILHDALYFPNAAWVNPQQLCKELTQHVNISIFTLTKLNNILKNKNIFEIYSNNILVSKSDVVIIANANEAQSFIQTEHIKSQAVSGQVSLLSPSFASRKLKKIVCSDGYFSPEVNNQHCLGATFSSQKTDLEINLRSHHANLEKLKNISQPLYQSLKDNITGGRVSLRCTTSDYFPLVGQLLDRNALLSAPPRPNAKLDSLPWIKGLFINVAHGSKGFTSAPICAEMLACLACNEPLPMSAQLAGLLNPNRFLLREIGLKQLAKTIAISS